jgi:hypothetical protein
MRNEKKNLSLYVNFNNAYLKFHGHHDLHKKFLVILSTNVNYILGVKTNSEISKRKKTDFFDMVYGKKNHSRHTHMYKSLNILMIYAN